MDWKLWVSSFIFVTATVLKLLFPEQTDDIRQKTVALIDMDMDYRVWVTEVGGMLTEESVYEVVHVFQNEEKIPIPVTDSETEDESKNLSDNSKASERVEAFLISQEAYSSYETPVNVSYDCLTLPFPFTSPVSGVLSSGFGYRVHPIDGQVAFHYGTDYDVEEGTTICSFADGTVYAVGEEDGYGKYIILEHQDGWRTLYAHCSETAVTAGQSVQMGEFIGESGQTGRVTGPHLHFELMCEGMYTNPEFFLA